MDSYLTTDEAAEYLAMTPNAIRQALSHGRIQAERVNGTAYFLEAELCRFDAERTRHLWPGPSSEKLRLCPTCGCMRQLRMFPGPTCGGCGRPCCKLCAARKSSAVRPYACEFSSWTLTMPCIHMERETLCPACARAAGWVRWEVEV